MFLDRDGVLTDPVLRDGRTRAPLSLETLRIRPDAAEQVGRLHDAGFLAVVVTNQPEVATGELSPAVLDEMHARLRRTTGVDAIYTCPHTDADACSCRKPEPGLLRRAADDLGIGLGASFLVGDRWRDIDAGRAAGCTTILVEGAESEGARPDARAAGLAEAVTIILAWGRGG